MHNDIAFGQYCEGHSVLHRMDPRMKLLLAILYIVVIFLAKSASAFLLLTVFSLCLIAVSGISPKMVLASMKPVLFIIIFTAVINIFWMAGDHLLFTLGPIKVYLEGIVNAVLVVLRILLLLICTSMFLTYTTTPIALTDGLEQALSPLKKLHVPVHELSMMMSIALRFIPTLIEETEKIISAQKARGADFDSGNLIQRAKAMIPILVPLFISAFRRADELATAMECRLYRGDVGRTRMRQLKIARVDICSMLLVAVLFAAVIALCRLGL